MASNKTKELLEISDEELVAEIKGSENDYQKLQFDHAVKGLDNPMEIRSMRRDIARLKTEARKRELAQFTPEQLAKRSKIRERRRRK